LSSSVLQFSSKLSFPFFSLRSEAVRSIISYNSSSEEMIYSHLICSFGF
jgi:hypothetical protein